MLKLLPEKISESLFRALQPAAAFDGTFAQHNQLLERTSRGICLRHVILLCRVGNPDVHRDPYYALAHA